MNEFVHLHVHTEYSLLDGAARIDKLFARCKELNMPAVALTDHGNMFGTIQFFKTAQKFGIKPIFGCEFYMCQDMKVKKGKVSGEFEHLVLLAKDKQGYKNIVKLDSLAYVDGFYYKPRIDMELLKKHSEGVICLSACLAGGIPQRLMHGDYEGAKKLAEEFISVFSKDDFYIEIQDHGIPEQKMILPDLIRLANELGVKTVATNDVHYVNRDDSEMQDVLLCIQTQKTLDDPTRMKFDSDQFYIKSYDEMNELFSYVPESLATTLEIAEKCNVEIEFKMPLLPNYIPPDNMTPEQYLKKLTAEGLARRYKVQTDEVKQRSEYELNIIITMGYVEYYLIVWDFINYARSQGIPVGAGRGSGVGSIVAYAVGITNVDPLKYNLLFERFLNPERVSMPDFDIDFCNEGRGQVIEYVRHKYGFDNVAQIATFGTMKAKGALKDVARVYKIPYQEVDKLAKLFPDELKMSLAQVFGLSEDRSLTVPELVDYYNNDPSIKKVVDMAMRIENMPRNVSMHAAGVVICKYVISDYVPLQRNGDDITTQFVKDEVEELGLLKMDFLGLKTLTDINKAIQYVKQTDGVDVNFEELGYDDKAVFELIGTGETDAVFQLESAGMKKFMRDLKPESLEDIIAGISLYRPGPMDCIPKYIDCKRNPDHIKYATPELEPLLNMTYGVIVYQEQVMQIVQRLAGFSLGQADIIRRVMSKKKESEMVKQRKIFLDGELNEDGSIKIEGAIRRGIDAAVAGEIFGEMESFARYAFNKSHAAAYAVLAYETAYLKRYYPVHFLVAVVNNRLSNVDDVTKYINFAREKGYSVKPPNVNRSLSFFSVDDGGILFGLAAVKGVGVNVTENIIKTRQASGEFKSLEDFMSRVDLSIFNRRMVENMIKAGVFDSFGKDRTQLLSIYDPMFTRHINENKVRARGQVSLFDMMGDAGLTDLEVASETVPPQSAFDRLMDEKDILGVYVTGHPLDEYRDKMRQFSFSTEMIPKPNEEDDLSYKMQLEGAGIKNDMKVKMAGLIFQPSRIMTKSGKEMGFFSLEDLYGSIEVVVFPNTFTGVKQEIIEDSVVVVEGSLMIREGDPVKLSLSKLSPFELSEKKKKGEEDEPKPEVLKDPAKTDEKLFLNLSKVSDESFEEILQILEAYEGGTEVVAKTALKVVKLPSVRFCPALRSELYLLLEKNDVVFK